MESDATPVMDIQAIKAVLPHRYPFLLLDRVTQLEPSTRIVAVKNVTGNEPFFPGHFPEYPVMPGVLIIEAMAQAGAVMMLSGMDEPKGKIPFFAGIDKARFRRQVVPGDRLELQVHVLRQRGGTCKLAGAANVDGQVAAEAEIMAMLGDPPSSE